MWKGLVFEPLGYRCAECQVILDETEKPAMLARGRWIATHPGRRVASFHLSALYSPWVTWETLRQEFVDAGKMPEKLQVFINTRLAECFNLDGEVAADGSALSERRVPLTSEVLDGVGLLTVGVDVQGDRLEFLLIGWGEGQQAWLLKHERIYGDPEQPAVWDDLDLLIKRTYALPNGAPLPIRCACVDSGAFTNAVYRYVRSRQRRGVYATKGMSTRGKALINRPGRANKQGVRVVPLGTETGKDVLFARLKQTTPGAGFVHITAGVTSEFLDQFGAETRRIRHERGVPYVEYHLRPGMRNEAIDLYVLSLAALHLLGAGVYDNLKAFVDRARALPAPLKDAPPAEEPPPDPAIALPAPPRPVAPRRGGYVGQW
jgi:phage terminase large subunit GpA-like protein